MKSALALAVVVVLCAVPVFAQDGNVSQGTLSALGLGGMQVMSDTEGMQVRGTDAAFGMVKGTSLIFGQLLTPDTKNFVIGSSVNEVDANAQTTAFPVTLSVFKQHSVSLDLGLQVAFPDTSVFQGMILGMAGGGGFVSTMPPLY